MSEPTVNAFWVHVVMETLDLLRLGYTERAMQKLDWALEEDLLIRGKNIEQQRKQVP